MKILITGGTGFIGRNLLVQYGVCHHVLAPSRKELNLLDAEAVGDYLRFHRFDAVIHSATERSNRLIQSPPDQVERNCRMFLNLTSNAHFFGRMLFLSSGAIYDRDHWQPRMAEDYCGKNIPADPYGLSKYLCAKTIEPAGNVYEFRLFGVFGPYEDWRVRFLSNSCCRAIFDIPLRIRQNVCFDYLDVEDLASLLEVCLTCELRHRHYNLCTGRVYDLMTLAEMVRRISARELDIKVKYSGLGTEYSGDNSRLMEEIPHYQFRAMEDSVAWLYGWYLDRKSTIDASQLRLDG